MWVKIVQIYALFACKISGPKIWSYKNFDKSHVCTYRRYNYSIAIKQMWISLFFNLEFLIFFVKVASSVHWLERTWDKTKIWESSWQSWRGTTHPSSPRESKGEKIWRDWRKKWCSWTPNGMSSACWYAFKAVLTLYQISLFSFPMPITNVRWPPRRLATGRRRWCTRGKRPRQLPASLESLRHSSRKRCWEIPNNEKPQFDAPSCQSMWNPLKPVQEWKSS